MIRWWRTWRYKKLRQHVEAKAAKRLADQRAVHEQIRNELAAGLLPDPKQFAQGTQARRVATDVIRARLHEAARERGFEYGTW